LDSSHAPAGIIDESRLLDGARQVLDANWIGASTVPSRSLYPHQWNWDSAFIAVGRAWYDETRARQELVTLFDAQWSNGMVPHIVFNPAVPDGAYFPGPDFWDSARSASAPRHVATSGITQPPIHAAAALLMHRHAKDVDGSIAFLRHLYPRLAAQHGYLASSRGVSGLGLPTILHPWESGLDNSPIWDRIMARLVIPPGGVAPYRRLDLQHADAEDRPTDLAYDRFVYLASQYRDSGYDDAWALAAAQFAMVGPLIAAIHVWSTHALAEIARVIGVDPTEHVEAAAAISAAMATHLWDAEAHRFDPLDSRTGELQPEHTIVSLIPLLDPDLPEELVDVICADLESACFHPDRPHHYLVPSDSVLGPDFDRRRYWRGPIWLNTNWLIWHGLIQHGRHDLANEVRQSSLALVSLSGYREYFDPFDGTGRGTSDFSWSAALTIDLIRSGLPSVR
jgi:hypothetical protein